MPRGDSISRYDGSADLFTIHSSPGKLKAAAKAAPSSAPGGLDSISRSELESSRAAPPKVEPSDFRVPKDKIVKIGTAGKFVFFAIAGPPYLLLFSLPKWMIKVALPKMFTFAQLALNQGQLLQKMLTSIWLKLKASFRNVSGLIRWSPKGLEKNQLQFLLRAVKVFLEPFNKLSSLYKLSLAKTEVLLKKFNESATRALEKLKTKIKEIAKKVTEPLAKVQTEIKRLSESLNPMPFLAPLIKFNPLPNYSFVKGMENFKNAFKKSKKKISEVLNSQKMFVAQFFDKAKVLVQPGFNLMAEQMQKVNHKFKAAYDFSQNQGKKLFKKASDAAKFVGSKISRRAAIVSNAIVSIWANFIRWCKEILFPWIVRHTAFVPKSINYIKNKSQEALRLTQKSASQASAFIASKMQKFKQRGQLAFVAIKNWISSFSFRKTPILMIKALFRKCRYMAQYSIWFLKEFFKAGHLLLDELSSEIGSWFAAK